MSEEKSYPVTRKGDVVDTYFGTEVPDPYRWLEDDLADETADWVAAQNKLTFEYLEQIPYRDKLAERLGEMWNYEKETPPSVEGGYVYFSRNDGLQNQYVVFRKEVGSDKEEVFLDPNSFSNDGTTSLSDLAFSKDGSLAAYSISEGGSDWRKIFVIDAKSRKKLEPELIDVKFSSISWLGSSGFYYSKYEKPEGSELSAKTDQHLLYFHKLGTPQSEDILVFGSGEEEKRRYVGGYVSEDDRYLTVTGAQSTSGNDLFIQDLANGGELTPVVSGFDVDFDIIDADAEFIYALTNKDAPNKRLVRFSLDAVADWQEVIPETDQVLDVYKGGGYFFAHYLVDATSRVFQFDKSGLKIRELALPDLGTAEVRNTKRGADKLYVSFTNYRLPTTIYEFEIATGERRVHRESKAKFASDQYESTQVFFESKDGTQVPMIITHKKGLELNGKNPTILYAYGGFNISLTPIFSIQMAVWMEQGGIYAVPNLRGGGEYGKAWHVAGTQTQKQNVFDDFIAAGEYLIERGYTSSDYLAVRGGSNGGLLVGAVMTQRPDLMQVALPAVGVLDMLRYHTFTAGAGWAYDYGTSEQSEEMFTYLHNYSPLHNVSKGTAYPATMVTTADHDDRVVPAHSFKFAAELQAKTAGPAPTLIRIDVNAGHGLGTPVSMLIDQSADLFSFTLHNMGIKALPESK